MSDFLKILLSFLMIVVLVVFVIETILLFKYGYLLPVRDIFLLILGK